MSDKNVGQGVESVALKGDGPGFQGEVAEEYLKEGMEVVASDSKGESVDDSPEIHPHPDLSTQ